jgi:hypothetical protein
MLARQTKTPYKMEDESHVPFRSSDEIYLEESVHRLRLPELDTHCRRDDLAASTVFEMLAANP